MRMKWKDEYENLASVVRDLEAELKTKDARIKELELAEKMREPLKTWEVTYGAGWVEEVSAHGWHGGSFFLHNNECVATFGDVQSVKLISTGE